MGNKKNDDNNLMAGILEGGIEQERMIRQIYQTYFYYVRQAINKHKISEDEAIDAYTDAVMVLRQKIVSGSFRGESTIATFLYRIFFNKCIDAIRKNTTKRLQYEFELPIHLEDKDPGIVKLLQIKEDFETLKEYMKKLSEICYQILMDAGYGGYSMEQIAKRIGFKDAQSVRSKKFTCTKKLFKLIEAGSKTA